MGWKLTTDWCKVIRARAERLDELCLMKEQRKGKLNRVWKVNYVEQLCDSWSSSKILCQRVVWWDVTSLISFAFWQCEGLLGKSWHLLGFRRVDIFDSCKKRFLQGHQMAASYWSIRVCSILPDSGNISKSQELDGTSSHSDQTACLLNRIKLKWTWNDFLEMTAGYF